MSESPQKADVKALTDAYDEVTGTVTFPDGVGAGPDKSSLDSPLPRKVTLASLQACVKNLEAKFSGNCNCLSNPDCCQTCQTTTCQSVYCQSQYCQSCQSGQCQSCQRDCSYCRKSH